MDGIEVTQELLDDVARRSAEWPGVKECGIDGELRYWNLQPGDCTQYRVFAIRADALGAKLGHTDRLAPKPCILFGWELSGRITTVVRGARGVTFQPFYVRDVMYETGMNEYNSIVFVRAMLYAVSQIFGEDVPC